MLKLPPLPAASLADPAPAGGEGKAAGHNDGAAQPSGAPVEEAGADASRAVAAAKRQRPESSAEITPQAHRAPAPAERGGHAADAPFVPDD
eukprot:921537-Prymnesium_polylepis.1